MKNSCLLLLILFSATAWANEKPNAWICDVIQSEGHPFRQLEITLKEPTVTLVTFYEQDNGSIKPSRKEEITATHVSSWKYPKNSCGYQGGFNSGELVDTFEATYLCAAGDAVITFSLDFKEGTAFYGEHLTTTGGDVSRYLISSNCRAISSLSK